MIREWHLKDSVLHVKSHGLIMKAVLNEIYCTEFCKHLIYKCYLSQNKDIALSNLIVFIL